MTCFSEHGRFKRHMRALYVPVVGERGPEHPLKRVVLRVPSCLRCGMLRGESEDGGQATRPGRRPGSSEP